MNFFLSLLYPPKCPFCHCSIPRTQTVCDSCRAAFPKVPRMAPLFTGELCIAPFTYESVVRRALLEYKYQGKKYYYESFASAIASAVTQVYSKNMNFEVITCVPMNQERKAVRGYNQSELIARNCAKLLDKPFENLLYRDNGAKEQHKLLYEQRLLNMNDQSIHAKDADRIRGKCILLIDDIVTSGATMSACCRVLKNSGAERIFCAAAAMHKNMEQERRYNKDANV